MISIIRQLVITKSLLNIDRGVQYLSYVEELRKKVGHQPLILVGSVAVIIDEFGRVLLQE